MAASDGKDPVARRGEIHDAVNHNGGGLEPALVHPGLESPNRGQLGDIVTIDLAERTVTPKLVSASVMRPVGGGATVLGE